MLSISNWSSHIFSIVIFSYDTFPPWSSELVQTEMLEYYLWTTLNDVSKMWCQCALLFHLSCLVFPDHNRLNRKEYLKLCCCRFIKGETIFNWNVEFWFVEEVWNSGTYGDANFCTQLILTISIFFPPKGVNYYQFYFLIALCYIHSPKVIQRDSRL